MEQLNIVRPIAKDGVFPASQPSGYARVFVRHRPKSASIPDTKRWFSVLAFAVLSCVCAWDCLSERLDRATPFFKAREAELDYHGPDEDLANAGEIIRIGWFGPTDETNQLGADMWWAANLAVDEANAASNAPGRFGEVQGAPGADLPTGTRRFTLRLVPRWGANVWGTGVSQLARMIYEEEPLAVIGSIDSSATHLAEQVIAKANLPLLSPITTDPSLTLAGVPWMFSCAPSDSAIARALVEHVVSALKPENGRLALLCATDHESRMTSREVARELARRQHPPAFRFEVPAGANDVSRQLAALKNAAPAAVLIIAGSEDSARLVRAIQPLHAQAEGISGGRPGLMVFGGQAMARRAFQEMAGPTAEEVCFPWIAAPETGSAEAARFVERFTAERQHPPDYMALLAYDATRLLVESIRQAGANRARLRDALSATAWKGIAGTIQFDGTGQNTRTNVQLATWRDGRIEPLKPFASGTIHKSVTL